MAYRIRIHSDLASVPGNVAYTIQTKATEAGFRIGDFRYVGWNSGRGPKHGSGKPGYVLDLAQIRLQKAKSYCGNHPGECVVGGPRRKAVFLEWDDWVKFHEVVNDILDEMNLSADITTSGADVDVGRLLFCRLGRKRRVRYDWTETSRNAFNAIRPVNYGTPDQFAEKDCGPEGFLVMTGTS